MVPGSLQNFNTENGFKDCDKAVALKDVSIEHHDSGVHLQVTLIHVSKSCPLAAEIVIIALSVLSSLSSSPLNCMSAHCRQAKEYGTTS